MKLLITGFGPFRDVIDNPSARLAAQLPGDTTILDVQYRKVEQFSRQELPFEAILCLGLNAKATDLQFELYAHNQIGSEPGHGSKPHRRTIIRRKGPRTLGQTLADPSRITGLPMAVSYSPGDYLCNFLLYSLLVRHPETRVGFIHIPSFSVVPQSDQKEQITALLRALELI